jgi:hypothetical protein
VSLLNTADRLRFNLQSIKTGVQFEELEISLFQLNKDYFQLFKTWEIDLEPLIKLHPIMTLRDNRTGLTRAEVANLDEQIKAIIERRPLLMPKYKWIAS